MKRSTPFLGLSDGALEFLRENASQAPVATCRKCGEVLGWKSKSSPYDVTPGMFGEEIPLMEYELVDGSYVKEIVQEKFWWGGHSVIFICLEREDASRIGEWSDEEIKEA